MGAFRVRGWESTDSECLVQISSSYARVSTRFLKASQRPHQRHPLLRHPLNLHPSLLRPQLRERHRHPHHPPLEAPPLPPPLPAHPQNHRQRRSQLLPRNVISSPRTRNPSLWLRHPQAQAPQTPQDPDIHNTAACRMPLRTRGSWLSDPYHGTGP